MILIKFTIGRFLKAMELDRYQTLIRGWENKKTCYNRFINGLEISACKECKKKPYFIAFKWFF